MCYLNKQNSLFTFVFLLMMLAVPYGEVDAMRFEPGNDTTIDCDVIVNYSAGWRVSDRDEDKLADLSPNFDDGDHNFDQWDMVNNKLTLLADIDIQHKNLGLFIRPKVFYDRVYMTDNSNDSPATNNALLGGQINEPDQWADAVEDVHGRDAEILDLFARGTFSFAGRTIETRVGKQVVSWGESLLVSGGISTAQSPVDISAAVAVGTELKEVFLPTESAFVQMGITKALSLSAYYQWRWDSNRFMEGGTAFSTKDFVDEIGAPLILGVHPVTGMPILFTRGQDDDAEDSGQYGVALNYRSNWFNDTEFGLYYINYHDKNPTINIDALNARYYLSFTEDIKLYGASFSTLIRDTNVSGEVSYRKDYVFGRSMNGAGPAVTGDYWQAQVSAIYIRSAKPIADSMTIMGEVARVQPTNVADDERAGLGIDGFAWRYVFQVGFDWYEVARMLDMGLDLNYSDVPSGTTNIAMGYTEGANSGSIGLEFVYNQVYKTKITYENRLSSNNDLCDRDTLALVFSYTF